MIYTQACRVVDQAIVDVGTGQKHGRKCSMVSKKRQLILTGMSEDELRQALLQEFPEPQPSVSIVEDEDGEVAQVRIWKDRCTVTITCSIL